MIKIFTPPLKKAKPPVIKRTRKRKPEATLWDYSPTSKASSRPSRTKPKRKS